MENKKTYVVTQEFKEYGEVMSNLIIYVGEDKEKAFSLSPEIQEHTLYLEVWANGKQLQGYYKGYGFHLNKEWELNFDRVAELERYLAHQSDELNIQQKELEDLKRLMK